jgi:hypothetical protein
MSCADQLIEIAAELGGLYEPAMTIASREQAKRRVTEGQRQILANGRV